MCVSSITYVPAEYLEEYKASLEQAQEEVSETAPVPVPAAKYVLTHYSYQVSEPAPFFSKSKHPHPNCFLYRDVPNLPEREDGEGEESASYSNWNQPRK